MNKEELRSKRAAVRREIKERMHGELEERKEEIKRRLKRNDLSVQEKRERYRSEVHSEKLRLMKQAKQEFSARKRMLGEAVEEEDYGEFREEEFSGAPEDVAETPGAAPEWHAEEDILLEEGDDLQGPADEVPPQDAFILESTTDEREAVRQYESPIGEYDALPPDSERFGVQPAAGPPAFVHNIDSGEIHAPNLFYYIWNLIFHPIQTLDEFDDYIAFPSGLRNVAIFYLLSLLPAVLAPYIAQSFGTEIMGGMASAIAPQQPGMLAAYGTLVATLLLYSLSIAAVNYLFTSEANIITLTTYFAFVEGVTGLVVYSFVIAAVFAAVLAPPVLLIVGLLFLLFIVWRIVLNIIVLVSAYGYGYFAAFLVIIGASIAQKIAFVFISGLIFGKSLEDSLYPGM